MSALLFLLELMSRFDGIASKRLASRASVTGRTVCACFKLKKSERTLHKNRGE